MKKQVEAKAAQMRRKVLGASALMVLLAACGDHPPKDDGEDDDDDDDAPPPAITIVAGNATVAGSTDAIGGAARFRQPHGIAIDAAGNLYVADRGNFTIRRITPNGVVTTVAGSAGVGESINGVGTSARFSNPVAIAIGPDNLLYIGDNRLIRRMGTGSQVEPFAEIPRGNNVAAASTPALEVAGLAVDARGNVIVTNGHSTRRIAPNGVSTTMLEGSEVLNNVSTTRTFVQRGVAVDADNNVYVQALDRTIARTNNSISLSVLAGTSGQRGSTDATGAAASFEDVVALTLDPQGNLYAADNINNLIRRITPAGVVTSPAGTLRATSLVTGALPGSFPNLRGLTTDGEGNYYATSGNAVIKITLP